MAEWLYEEGIGENRAALVDRGEIVEAAIELEGEGPRVGDILPARLSSNGRILLEGGAEAVLDPVPSGLSEGSALLVEIVREPISERGRSKLAKAVAAAEGAGPRPGPSLFERIASGPRPVRRLEPHEPDLLEQAGWSELVEEAAGGEIAFRGGALRVAVTPAMTLIDVDGPPPLRPLAIAAATAAARAIVRHGIAGSIGIDFPTLADRAVRQQVAGAIDAVLPKPFERTGVNGFGFLQIVRRRTRASLPELVQTDPIGARARGALRSAERVPPGVSHPHIVEPDVLRRLQSRSDWLGELERRRGAPVHFVERGSRG